MPTLTIHERSTCNSSNSSHVEPKSTTLVTNKANDASASIELLAHPVAQHITPASDFEVQVNYAPVYRKTRF
jgi:hypothetical protein